MTSDLDSGGESPIELRHQRVFRVRLWAGVVGYLLASFVSYQWGPHSGPWRIVLAALPLLFMAGIVTVIALRVRQMDEYQRKLFFPGLAVGFVTTLFAAVAAGTLSAAGLDVPSGGWPVAVVGILAWGITNRVVHAAGA